MRFRLIKNTVLFILFLLVSCRDYGTLGAINQKSAPKDSTAAITIAANRTERYLPLLTNKSVAVVANQTSVIFKNRFLKHKHLVDSLLALDVNVTKVFAPEHGFRGTADAGELVSNGTDTKTGLPIVSLYGTNKKPNKDQLQNVDLVLFDIQDVGVRFYTYISTLHYVMEACAEQDIPVVVLDRPNPNGNYVDGPVLEQKHSSFLGMHPVPLVHGMTIGEYAEMINGEKWLSHNLSCNLTVIKMHNYTHETTYSLPIRPSPNLPNDQAIRLYPSLGLFEGTNINAGRGTEFQFQRYGAPFLDENKYSFSYTPAPNFGAKNPKHNGKVCYGRDLSSDQIERSFTLRYILEAYQNSIDKSQFFVSSNFTAHAGTTALEKQIVNGWSATKIRNSWQADLERFKVIRKHYLLYP